MTAAMLVLEPIFEADLPPEQYAYRPGRNAQQAVVEVEGLLFRGRPDVVDARHRLAHPKPNSPSRCNGAKLPTCELLFFHAMADLNTRR